MGKRLAKEPLCMTHGHGLKWGLTEWGRWAGQRGQSEKKQDDRNGVNKKKGKKRKKKVEQLLMRLIMHLPMAQQFHF